MSICVAKTIPDGMSGSEFTIRGAENLEIAARPECDCVSLIVPFDHVRNLVESAQPPRRPNRSKPTQHTTDAEISAWEAASDSSLLKCAFWE